MMLERVEVVWVPVVESAGVCSCCGGTGVGGAGVFIGVVDQSAARRCQGCSRCADC